MERKAPSSREFPLQGYHCGLDIVLTCSRQSAK